MSILHFILSFWHNCHCTPGVQQLTCWQSLRYTISNTATPQWPGVVNRTNPNQKSIELNRTQSNWNFWVSLITELNRTNQTESIRLFWFCNVELTQLCRSRAKAQAPIHAANTLADLVRFRPVPWELALDLPFSFSPWIFHRHWTGLECQNAKCQSASQWKVRLKIKRSIIKRSIVFDWKNVSIQSSIMFD